MDPKPRPNHREYIETLRRMTPEQRLQIAFDESERFKERYRRLLRRRFPELSDDALHKLFIERVAKHANWVW